MPTAAATAEERPADPAAGPRGRRAPGRLAAAMPGYGLVLPALLLALLVFVGGMAILADLGMRPFAQGRIGTGVTLDNLRRFVTGGYYWGVVGTTLELAGACTVVCVAIGYPAALALSRARSGAGRAAAYFLIFSPLLTSVIVRTYGWEIVLGDAGVINRTLSWLGLTDQPVHLLYEFTGVVVAMVHVLLPFMVFPIVGVLAQLDPALEEAAADLGASRTQTFWRVVMPLSVHGVLVGIQLTFALAASAFATPSLLGGGRVQVLASLVYTDVGGLDWPLAAVESYVLLALALVVISLLAIPMRLVQRRLRVGA
jgi:putative spermidine/putrescine transport system permease protein